MLMLKMLLLLSLPLHVGHAVKRYVTSQLSLAIPLADQCCSGKDFGSREHLLALNFIISVWNSLPVDIVNFGFLLFLDNNGLS